MPVSVARAYAIAIACACALLAPRLARAQDLKDRFNIRVLATAGYLTESQDAPSPQANQAGTFSLGYLDLRAVIDARRLPGSFELHLDGRARITGEIDTPTLYVAGGGTTARGYLGGREYELREAYVRRRGAKIDFALGRMYVLESDFLKIDGARLWWRFKKHWDFSVYAGGYPNPYSRSLTTDYMGSNGYYGPSIAGGADISYVYDKVWGSVSATGAYLGGNDDGGAFDPNNPVGRPTTEGGRFYITWTGFERFLPWLDVYHDLVLDTIGAAGVQLTRLDSFVTARAHKYFSIRAGYDHLSSLAIEMFLTNLLNNRTDFKAPTVPTIENNLIVERTARDQVSFNPDFHFQKLNVWADARLRWRTLVNAGEDPQFVNPANKNQVAASFAWDFTVGIRDLGSLKGLREGLWYTYLADYRSLSYIVGFELGRNFWNDRLTADINFLYARTTDVSAGNPGNDCRVASPNFSSAPNNTGIPLACFGTRDGQNYEPGVTLTINPFRHWFALADYRLVVNTNDPGAKAILTHSLVVRIEARY